MYIFIVYSPETELVLKIFKFSLPWQRFDVNLNDTSKLLDQERKPPNRGIRVSTLYADTTS